MTDYNGSVTKKIMKSNITYETGKEALKHAWETVKHLHNQVTAGLSRKKKKSMIYWGRKELIKKQ